MQGKEEDTGQYNVSGITASWCGETDITEVETKSWAGYLDI